MTSARPAYGRVWAAHTPIRGATRPGLHIGYPAIPAHGGFVESMPRSETRCVAPGWGTGQSERFCGTDALTGYDSETEGTRKRLTSENPNGQIDCPQGWRGQALYLRISRTERAS